MPWAPSPHLSLPVAPGEVAYLRRPRPRRSAEPTGSTTLRPRTPVPNRGCAPPARSVGLAVFFTQVLRVRARDPAFRPFPRLAQPFQRTPDGLVAHPLGRDPLLTADFGCQIQRPQD